MSKFLEALGAIGKAQEKVLDTPVTEADAVELQQRTDEWLDDFIDTDDRSFTYRDGSQRPTLDDYDAEASAVDPSDLLREFGKALAHAESLMLTISDSPAHGLDPRLYGDALHRAAAFLVRAADIEVAKAEESERTRPLRESTERLRLEAIRKAEEMDALRRARGED